MEVPSSVGAAHFEEFRRCSTSKDFFRLFCFHNSVDFLWEYQRFFAIDHFDKDQWGIDMMVAPCKLHVDLNDSCKSHLKIEMWKIYLANISAKDFNLRITHKPNKKFICEEEKKTNKKCKLEREVFDVNEMIQRIDLAHEHGERGVIWSWRFLRIFFWGIFLTVYLIRV